MVQSAYWRVAVDRAEKRELVTSLNGIFTDSGSVVVAHYVGLTVAQLNDLRSRMRSAGGSVKVAKNSLAKIALQGTVSEKITDLFVGQTIIAYAADPVAAPKVAMEFAKINEKLVILGGAMGATSLNAEKVKALASMPSLDELRAKTGWHDCHPGNPHRADRQRASGSACPRVWSLCPEGRSGMRLLLAANTHQTSIGM